MPYIYLKKICIIIIIKPGLYGDNGILPARTQVDLEANATLFYKLKQKPTLLWFAPYIGLNVEYMLDVLSLLGVILSFAGYAILNIYKFANNII